VKHSLGAARDHFQRAADAGSEDARTLLSQVPAGIETWPGGVVPEPEHGESWPSVAPAADKKWERPAWAKERPDWRKYRGPHLPIGNFAFEQTIAVGVPERHGPSNERAGIARNTGCLSLEDGGKTAPYLSLRTWHSNHDACSMDVFVVDTVGNDLVLFGNDYVNVNNAKTGEQSTVEGCFLRAARSPDRLVFAEDWPVGCARDRCGSRGAIVGKAIPLTPTKEPCKDIYERELRSVANALIGQPPEWISSAEPLSETALDKVKGTWRTPHAMPVVAGEDAEGEATWEDYRVTDEFRVCKHDDGTVQFNLVNFTVNDHSCDLEGIVMATGTNELLLSTGPVHYATLPGSRDISPGQVCHLRVQEKKGRLDVVDVWPPECFFETCGARASPTDATFARKRRRANGCATPWKNPLE